MHRITGLEQQKKDYESQLAAEETSAIQLDKYMVIYWLDQFKHGDVDDERFRRNLINLLVNSVTIWDDPDGGFRITTAYNLTDTPTKTFRVEALPGSDMGSSSPPQTRLIEFLSGGFSFYFTRQTKNPSALSQAA